MWPTDLPQLPLSALPHLHPRLFPQLYTELLLELLLQQLQLLPRLRQLLLLRPLPPHPLRSTRFKALSLPCPQANNPSSLSLDTLNAIPRPLHCLPPQHPSRTRSPQLQSCPLPSRNMLLLSRTRTMDRRQLLLLPSRHQLLLRRCIPPPCRVERPPITRSSQCTLRPATRNITSPTQPMRRQLPLRRR